MALKKSDLYRSLWASGDELRGVMDASLWQPGIVGAGKRQTEQTRVNEQGSGRSVLL